jgi:hypothetical protein
MSTSRRTLFSNRPGGTMFCAETVRQATVKMPAIGRTRRFTLSFAAMRHSGVGVYDSSHRTAVTLVLGARFLPGLGCGIGQFRLAYYSSKKSRF